MIVHLKIDSVYRKYAIMIYLPVNCYGMGFNEPTIIIDVRHFGLFFHLCYFD